MICSDGSGSGSGNELGRVGKFGGCNWANGRSSSSSKGARVGGEMIDDVICDGVRTGEFGGDGGDSDCGVGGEAGGGRACLRARMEGGSTLGCFA